jgi:hypothetical protein
MLPLIAILLLSQPPSQAPAELKGTAVVRGRITAADTGRPLRRAQIRVSSVEQPQGRTTSTNVRGEWEIKEIPPGRYTVSVTRSGYLPMQYGQRYYGELARPLQVDDGRVLERVDFALPRAGVLSGRITDETGEPVSGASVWVMRTEYFRGRRRAVTMGNSANTDDTGHYRASGIPPGEYTLMAMLPSTWIAGPEKQKFGYAPSYYPGIPSYADALRVKVGPGQEAANLDFPLVAARAAALSGTAMKSDGTPLSGSTVSLTREVAGPTFSSSSMVANGNVAADGSWTIKGIPPGEYRLEVSSRDRPPEQASTTIALDGNDVTGITLVTDAGGIVSGQVVTDDGQPLPPSRGGVRVVAEGVGPDRRPMMFVSGDEDGLVNPDGAFALSGVVGPAFLRVAGLPPAWRVSRVDVGGEDHAQKPLRPTSYQKVGNVRIVVTNRFPTLMGRVTGDDGQPAEASVVLIPEDESAWIDTGLLYRARPDQSGIFRIEAVRPGDYLAVALELVEAWQLQDPEYLATLRDRATRVTLREGPAQQLDLKVAK